MTSPTDATTVSVQAGASSTQLRTAEEQAVSARVATEQAQAALDLAKTGPTAQDIGARHPELDDVDSVIWFEPVNASRPETVLTKSTAALRVLRYLGGVWRALGVLGAIVPRFIRDAVYDLIARHRHRLIRGAPMCVIPEPVERARFLD